MTVEEIKELVAIANESGVAELEVQRGENRVRIRRQSLPAAQEIVVAAAAPPQMVAQAPQVQPATASAAIPAPAAPSKPAPEEAQKLIKSPIVGTFYESPSPGAPPFVKVGDHVRPGQVLCIIESMKLMNEIEAEVSGTIVSQFVENGRPVEYGEALFAVKPD